MKRILLDTQAIIWWDMGSPNLGPVARSIIANAAEVYVSAVSEWEMSIKYGLGKVITKSSIQSAVQSAGFVPLNVSFDHALTVRQLKPIHKDPFDRLLVATAMVEGLEIVTSDQLLIQYPVRIIDARK